MTKIDLSGVDAWKGGGLLPPGKHHVEITNAIDDDSKSSPRVEVELRAVGGPNDGGTIRDWLTLSEAAFGRIRQFLEAVKYTIPDGPFDMPTTELIGRQCTILVREEPYNGEMKSKVKAYEAATGDLPATAGSAAGSASTDLPF